MASKRKKGHQVGITVLSPGTVDAEVQRTRVFIDQLSAEIAVYYAGITTATPEQHAFITAYAPWRQAYNDWYNKHSPVGWGSVLVLKAIEEENEKWQKQAEEKQAEFRKMGGTSGAKPPPPIPGGSGGGGLGTFFAGMSTGTLVAIAIAIWVMSEDKGKRRLWQDDA